MVHLGFSTSLKGMWPIENAEEDSSFPVSEYFVKVAFLFGSREPCYVLALLHLRLSPSGKWKFNPVKNRSLIKSPELIGLGNWNCSECKCF